MPYLDKVEIATTYQQLLDSKNTNSRGYALEKLLASVLLNESLEPRTSYRPKGEEIDGSFFWEGQTFLLEAKWHAHPIPVSMIYSFKGKLDGKFHTTSGVFISMSGYSPEAVDALKFGKTLNIIFFDNEDLAAVLLGKELFLDVLKYKLRQAGDTGSIYAPYKLRKQAEKIAKDKPVFYSEHGVREGKDVPKDILVFVEQKSDIDFARALLIPLAIRHMISFGVVSMNGFNGIKDLPALLNTYGANKGLKGAIVLLGEEAQTFDSVITNIHEQIEKSANPVKIMTQFLSEKRKSALSKENDIEELDKDEIFALIDSFIDELLYRAREPLYYIPTETIEGALASLTWDKKNGVARYESSRDREPDGEFADIDELVKFVEDEIYSALENELPPFILNDAYNRDYTWEIREFIGKHYLDKIKSLGWNPDDV